MGHPTTLQARAALRGGFIALGMLAFAHCAPATENSPRMPPEKEPAAWQRAGLEAALGDPDFVVQYHALDYCLRKKWVVQLHFSTEQWLKWLGHENSEVQALAAEATGQLGAQMPAEVQRTLARLRKTQDADTQVRQAATRALLPLGAGMIPEVQLELVAAHHETPLDYDFTLQIDLNLMICQALGQTGAAMAPATLEALLALMKDPQTAAGSGPYAAKTLAHLGPHMPPQVRELMLGLLLDARADISVRGTAAEAMGRLGPHLPPEVQQALLAAYAEPPPAKADVDAIRYHALFHQQVAEALGLPPAIQQALLDRFLKAAHAPQPPEPQEFGSTPERDHPGAELRILAKAGPHASPAVLHALLAEFQSPAASDATRESIAESFFQPLAERGALPPAVQRTLLACVQDEKASLQARSLAAQTLGHLGANASPEAKQALLLLLQNKDQQHSLRFGALLAMQQLGPHMPPEAGPLLVGIVERNIAADRARSATSSHSQPADAPPSGPDPFGPIPLPSPATSSPPAADPFGPSAASPAAATSAPSPVPPAAPAAESAPASVADTYSMPDEFPIEHAVPALGNLGEKMPPEAQTALLGVLRHPVGSAQTPWDAAYALAQMGDTIPPLMQQILIALLRQPEPDFARRLAIYRTLGVSGVHPASDAQLAALLAMTYGGEADAELRFYLYLWLGRSPAHLMAVRWLGNTQTDPPLGDTPPQEILSLISRLWPHSAAHADLRRAMARRTSMILTTHLKSHPLDAATQKVLRSLASQFAEDRAADCATALEHVQAASGAAEKAR